MKNSSLWFLTAGLLLSGCGGFAQPFVPRVSVNLLCSVPIVRENKDLCATREDCAEDHSYPACRNYEDYEQLVLSGPPEDEPLEPVAEPDLDTAKNPDEQRLEPSELMCGNGVIDAGEACDNADWGNVTGCGDFGYEKGLLFCNSSCQFDASGCFNPTEVANTILEILEPEDDAEYVISGPPVTITFLWSAVAGARQYRIFAKQLDTEYGSAYVEAEKCGDHPDYPTPVCGRSIYFSTGEWTVTVEAIGEEGVIVDSTSVRFTVSSSY